MLITTSLTSLPPLSEPFGLTIGSFDGLHLGHQALIKHLRKSISQQGTLAVLTFSNHPSQVLTHRPAAPLIASLEHKLKLLEELGVNLVFLLEFSPDLASQTYDQFLKKIRTIFPFSHLVLGAGAALGKGQQGDKSKLIALGKTEGFEVEYVDKLMEGTEPISSRRIRGLIQTKEFKKTSQLLGRPYSLYGRLEVDPTDAHQATLSLAGIGLPPSGTYPIKIERGSKAIEGEAFIDSSQQLLILKSSKNLAAWDDLFVEVVV